MVRTNTGSEAEPKNRILVVDDDFTVRRTIKLALPAKGYAVTEGADGGRALELFTDEDFDLLITDLDMPGIKGDKLASTRRGLAPRFA